MFFEIFEGSGTRLSNRAVPYCPACWKTCSWTVRFSCRAPRLRSDERQNSAALTVGNGQPKEFLVFSFW